MRRMWQKSTARWKHRWQNNHVLACQISVCWSLYFNWTALHLQVQLTMYILNSDLCKIRLVLHLLKCDYCIHRGVSIHAVPQIYPIFTAVTIGFRSYVYWTMHLLDSWIETSLMSLAFLFHYLMLNMMRMLIHPSSGACDLFVELFHGLYCSGLMRVGVTVWFGWGGVVSRCRLKHYS